MRSLGEAAGAEAAPETGACAAAGAPAADGVVAPGPVAPAGAGEAAVSGPAGPAALTGVEVEAFAGVESRTEPCSGRDIRVRIKHVTPKNTAE